MDEIFDGRLFASTIFSAEKEEGPGVFTQKLALNCYCGMLILILVLRMRAGITLEVPFP